MEWGRFIAVTLVCAGCVGAGPPGRSLAPVHVSQIGTGPAPIAEPPAPAPAPAEAPKAPPAAAAPEAPSIDALLASLTLEQKVGQLMMIGFKGTEVGPQVESMVQGWQVGGVCLFKWNIVSAEQVATLNDGLRALLPGTTPPFIAVDQEGGNVVRISDGNIVLPGNMALAATRSPQLAYEAGRAQAEDLKRLGFNMNLAPVLDVNVNPRNPVIGIRSFGDNIDLVARLGAAFVRGQRDAQIVTVAKHFPGHGSVDADSHRMLPVVTESEEELLALLSPFEAAMKEGLDGMMTAHVATPALTGDDTPATLSEPVLGELLRGRMNFHGLVITDELEMHAIEQNYGVGQAAVLAVQAGADMVLVPWRMEKKEEVRQALLDAVRSGALPMARLDESVRRVLEVKRARGLMQAPPPREERLAHLGERRALAQDIANDAVTLIKADRRSFPLAETKRIAVITPEVALADAVARRAPETRSMVVPSWPEAKSRAALKVQARRLAENADVVVVGVENGRQLELVTNAALAGKPVVVVVMGVPYLVPQLFKAGTVVAVYSYQPTAAEAAVGALFGERGTPGRLPVALPRYPFGHGLDPVGSRMAHGGDASRPSSTGTP